MMKNKFPINFGGERVTFPFVFCFDQSWTVSTSNDLIFDRAVMDCSTAAVTVDCTILRGY